MCIMSSMESNKNYKHLLPIAEYHLKQIRTEGEYLHIGDVKEYEDHFVFFGCYRGKKKRLCKGLKMDKEGNVIE